MTLDEAIKPIAATTATRIALDVEDIGLTDQVAEDDGAVAGLLTILPKGKLSASLFDRNNLHNQF